MTTRPAWAATRVAMALPMPEPAPLHQRDPGGECLRLRHALQLGLFQRPVLDGELLRLADRGGSVDTDSAPRITLIAFR